MPERAFACLRFPSRSVKPRADGLTIAIDGMDSGYLGPNAQEDLLATAAEYVDFVKIGWVLGALQSFDALAAKVARYQAAGVEPFPGGVLLEMATVQDCVGATLQAARAVGYRWVEVSCSLVALSIDERIGLVRRARDAGFHVLGEVGEKGATTTTTVETWAREAARYLENGADYVILESERLDPFLRTGSLTTLISALPEPRRLIWEIPYGYPLARISEMAWVLVRDLGPNVNVANVEPHHLLAVESIRRRACFGGSFLGDAFRSDDPATKGATEARD